MICPLLLVSLSLLVVCLSTGFLVQYVFRDFSKISGYLLQAKCGAQFNVVIHILAGVVTGCLVLPVFAYGLFDEQQYCSDSDGAHIWIRQIIGCLVFVIFTVRNLCKHPRNLRRNLKKVDMSDEYSLFRSSVTRQQMQFGIGIACVGLVFACAFPGAIHPNRHSIKFFAIAACIAVQAFLQLLFHHDCSQDMSNTIDKFKRKLRYKEIEMEHDVATWREVLLRSGLTEDAVDNMVMQVTGEYERLALASDGSETESDSEFSAGSEDDKQVSYSCL